MNIKNTKNKAIIERLNELKNNMSLQKKSIEKDESTRILEERAKLLAGSGIVSDSEEDVLDILEFKLGQENYAFDAKHVSEVLKSINIYDLPSTPPYFYGIINLRGKIVSIIDLKKFLSLQYKGIADNSSIIIIDYKDVMVGVVADEVMGLKKIPRSQIQKSGPKLRNIKESFLIGISHETLIILDIIKLLNEKRIQIESKIS